MIRRVPRFPRDIGERKKMLGTTVDPYPAIDTLYARDLVQAFMCPTNGGFGNEFTIDIARRFRPV